MITSFVVDVLGFVAMSAGKLGALACVFWSLDEEECPKSLIK